MFLICKVKGFDYPTDGYIGFFLVVAKDYVACKNPVSLTAVSFISHRFGRRQGCPTK
jgi:hypothetical protein